MNKKYLFLVLLISKIFALSSLAQTTEVEPNNVVDDSGIKYITGAGVYQGATTLNNDDDIWYIPFGSSGTISITFDTGGASGGAYLQYYGNSSYYNFDAGSYISSISLGSTKNINLSANTYYFFVVRANTADGIGPWQFTINSVGTIVGGVSFTSGGSFTPNVIAGNSTQVIGRFELEENITGVNLSVASIKLNGTRTGMSNIKLWHSTNSSFEAGTDTQLGSTTVADPGNGNSVSFSSFSQEIGRSGSWFFLTADIAAGATGAVEGILVNNSSLTFSNGQLSSSITNAPLSNGDVSLPVQLALFSAKARDKGVILEWITESEVNNLGFILDRSPDGKKSWQTVSSFRTNDQLISQGNRSDQTKYSFIDESVQNGKQYFYRLSEVNMQGEISLSAIISIQIEEVTDETCMENAYPNPFNPQTFIAYKLAEETDLTITVFNLLGRSVKLLYDGHQQAGNYQVYWNGTTDKGLKASSGAYIIRMRTGKTTRSQKVMFMN